MECKKIEDEVRGMMKHEVFDGEQGFSDSHREMKANTMLTVRHLEDARMRLGKCVQYSENDGKSILG